MTIRVLRILEYVYETPERMAQDMQRWGVGANASYEAGRGLTIRSATMPAEVADTAIKESTV